MNYHAIGPDRRAETQMVALRHGIAFPQFECDIPDMSWSDLHDARKRYRRFASALLDRLAAEKRKPDEGEQHAVEYATEFIEWTSREMDHRSEMGHVGARHDWRGAAGNAIESGWHTRDGTPVPVLTRDQRVGDFVGAGGRVAEDSDLRLGRMILALRVGGKEAGLSDAEQRALSEATDAAGGFTVNPVLSAQLIDRARPLMRVIQAGALTVPFDAKELKIARISADPTVAWHAENASETDSQPTLQQVTFTARTLMCIVKASQELVDDSLNIEDVLLTCFARAMAGEVDRVALYGTGVAPQPAGLSVTSGINEVTSLGTLADWDPLVDGVEAVLTDNHMPTACILHPRTLAKFAKLKDTTNQALRKPEFLDSLRLLPTTQVSADDGGSPAATSAWIGDFTQMMIGVRSQLRVEVLRERYRDAFQLGFIGSLRLDTQLRHPAAFCRVRLDY